MKARWSPTRWSPTKLPDATSILTAIRTAAAGHGLNLVAAVPVARYDAVVHSAARASLINPATRSIVVLGNGVGDFWAALKRHAARNPGWWERENPLDDFTRDIVEREKPGGQFRTDAGRIAHGECDSRSHHDLHLSAVNSRAVAPSCFRSPARPAAAPARPRQARPTSSPGYCRRIFRASRATSAWIGGMHPRPCRR